jgi:hypothetical protein
MSGTRPTPTVEILYNVTNLNSDISTLSSYVQSLGPSGGPTTAQFQALSNEYNAESTNISSLAVAYSTNLTNFNSLSSYYTVLSSGLNLVAKVGYLSSLTTLYLGASTFASSLTINRSLIVGSNTIATGGGNAAIGSNNTMNNNYGLVLGQLNSGSVGTVAQGYGNNVISGTFSHAEGSSSEIQGSYSHTEGGNNSNFGQRSHVEGYRNTVDQGGSFSHAEGYGQYILDNIDFAHAEGYFTNVYEFAHAEGTFTSSLGSISHAEGFGSVTNGSNSHAEGWLTDADGAQSHAEGYSTFVSTNASNAHAEGSFTIVTAPSGHAEGFQTTVTGSYAHAEGWAAYASSIASHAEGQLTEADGDYSHAEGQSTIASGILSHVEGSNNREAFDGSHVENTLNSSIGSYCHVHGVVNIASSIASHAHGIGNRSLGNASHAHGSNAYATGIASHAHGGAFATSTSGAFLGAFGNYSHAHGSNVGVAGLAATAIGASGTTIFRNAGNYAFTTGNNYTVYGENTFGTGNTYSNQPGYNYMSYLGGITNTTRTGGSYAISSTTVVTAPQGWGSRILGGSWAYPRTNWSIVNSPGRIGFDFGTCQTELFNLYCTTSNIDTYCNFIYLSNKADQPTPTTSNMPAYVENNRYHANVFEIQVMGYEKANISTVTGTGVFSANYRFNCYWDNTSTITAGIRFRTWTLCDSDGNTIGVNTFKELSSINFLNKLSGTPDVSVQAYISTTLMSNPGAPNMQSITALSVKANTVIPINWYTQVKQGVIYYSGGI